MEECRILIARGIDIDLQAFNGYTALMFATWYGHTQIVRELVSAGAALDVQNIYDYTALMLVETLTLPTKLFYDDIIKILKKKPMRN